MLSGSELILFCVSVVTLLAIELIYFEFADRNNIIDKPNHRSSHTLPTIRGGGIIFIVGVILWCAWQQGTYWKLTVGLMLIAVISFLDDMKEQPARVRLVIHGVAILFLFYEVGFFENHALLLISAFIIVVGALNAFNFMDGINGITGIYAAVNLITFLFIQQYILNYTESTLLIVTLAGIFVFLIFNFRRKARCFAGDVGSVGIAFLQVFFLLALIQHTEHFGFVLFFLVFGVDSTITIIHRLIKKENIFQPHRTHLYQYLANEFRLPHRLVAASYGSLQLIINTIVIYLFVTKASVIFYFAIGGIFALLYLASRMYTLTKFERQIIN